MKSVAEVPHQIAHGIAALAVGTALAVGAAGAAQASPPAVRASLTRTTDDVNRSSGLAGPPREFGRRDLPPRLDLRAPADFAAARPQAPDSGPADFAAGSVAFPSPRYAAKSESVEEQPAALRSADTPPKIASPAEQFARRFHREGLPLARLWQTRSAMLSLGLSPRGKPGIWLIQKVP